MDNIWVYIVLEHIWADSNIYTQRGNQNVVTNKLNLYCKIIPPDL